MEPTAARGIPAWPNRRSMLSDPTPRITTRTSLVARVSCRPSNRQVSIEDVFGCGDRVVGRTVMHATHAGALGEFAATGRSVQLASTIIYRFEDGHVVEEWEILDKLGMYQQLGMLPPASDVW